MKIPALLQKDKPAFSFEYFPPKTPEGERKLFDTVERLKELEPAYVSVTYGAGGSTQRKTIEIVQRIQRESGLTAMAHLTTVGHTRDEMRGIVSSILDAGIENILALRGDHPKDDPDYRPPEDGFRYASELAGFIRANWPDVAIAGACYPETHQDAPSPEADIANLKKKVEAGAQYLITQLFFVNEHHWDFLARARGAGIRIPIIPGLMPVTNANQIQRITAMCGAVIPEEMQSELERVKDDPQATLEFGVEWTYRQARELLDNGAPGIHFYTLNRSPATRWILEKLYARGYREKLAVELSVEELRKIGRPTRRPAA